jgi:hypothetical protein
MKLCKTEPGTIQERDLKLLVRNAVVGLREQKQDAPVRPVPGQTVVIYRTGADVIGIDGHTGFQDQLVEVRWDGSHRDQLVGVGHVEITDQTGRVVESLPVQGDREPFEKDGETVFFLMDQD